MFKIQCIIHVYCNAIGMGCVVTLGNKNQKYLTSLIGSKCLEIFLNVQKMLIKTFSKKKYLHLFVYELHQKTKSTLSYTGFE